MATQPHSFTRDFIAQLKRQPLAAVRNDFPFYDYEDAHRTVAGLAGTSRPLSFRMGTGESIYAKALAPAMLEAQSEIILVTCFWAPSKSLSDISQALTEVARRRQDKARQGQQQQPPLRIRIGFSSRSLMQKLLHTSSRDGYVNPPDTWSSLLGLPAADVLQAAGIDLRVKSLFFLPFSVMHPKFVIIDRRRVFVPSCNVSWEPWLEGCIELEGDVVKPLVDFYERTWERQPEERHDVQKMETSYVEPHARGPDDLQDAAKKMAALGSPSAASGPSMSPVDVDGPGSIVVRFGTLSTIPTVILPSSHHRNPRFRPFPWQAYPPPPPTPLNVAILHLLDTAQQSVYIQTPNLTAGPAIDSILAALARGVAVTIVTGRSMMVYEQLATAMTTTAQCLRKLIKRYEKGSKAGALNVSYFQPLVPGLGADGYPVSKASMPDDSAAALLSSSPQPVKSHIKLTIVDGQHTLLGSGNMDRASWYTSQEMGVLFHDGALSLQIKTAVERVLEGRLEKVYP